MRTCRNSPFVWMVLNGEDLVPTYNPFLCKGWFSLYHGFVEKDPLSHEMQYFERHTNLWAFQNWAWQSSKSHGQTASFSGWDKYPSAGYVEWWPLGWFTLALFWLVPLCDSAALMYSRHLCRTSGEACLFLFFSSHSLSLVVVLNKIPASYWYICSLISGLDCCQYQKLDIEISFFMHQLPWN